MFKYFGLALLLFIGVSVVACRRNPFVINSDQDDIVKKKSEVTLKFSTYAMKIPPLIQPRNVLSAAVKPVEVYCNSPNVTKSLLALRKKIQCIPREVIVDLEAPNNLTVDPPKVVVKRCEGLCKGNKKCIPTGIKLIEFYVTSTNPKNPNEMYCNRIEVEEHTYCKCSCKKKCSLPLKLDLNRCKCVCPDYNKQSECAAKPADFRWDHASCSCKCRNVRRCTTGTRWDSEICRCIKI